MNFSGNEKERKKHVGMIVEGTFSPSELNTSK